MRWPWRRRSGTPDPLGPRDVVVSTDSVLHGRQPVCLAAHLYSDTWLFLPADTSDGSGEQPVAAHWAHLVETDPSLADLAGLAQGDLLVRRPGSEWTRVRFWSDSDYDRILDGLDQVGGRPSDGD